MTNALGNNGKEQRVTENKRERPAVRGVKKSLKRRLHKKLITTGTEVFACFCYSYDGSLHENVMHTRMERLTSFPKKGGRKTSTKKNSLEHEKTDKGPFHRQENNVD